MALGSPARADVVLGAASGEAKSVVDAARAWGTSRPAVPAPPAAPQGQAQEPDYSCGPFGALCADVLPAQEPLALAEAPAAQPINRGFQALGAPGSKGSIDGPGSKGNGSFRIELNDPFEIRLWIDTGYTKARMTLKRDPATGVDTMRFEGRMWEDGRWSDHRDKISTVFISYDAGRDRGSIKWKEKGQWKQENYWDGRAGRRAMVIELGGGWDHEFKRD